MENSNQSRVEKIMRKTFSLPKKGSEVLNKTNDFFREKVWDVLKDVLMSAGEFAFFTSIFSAAVHVVIGSPIPFLDYVLQHAKIGAIAGAALRAIELAIRNRKSILNLP